MRKQKLDVPFTNEDSANDFAIRMKKVGWDVKPPQMELVDGVVWWVVHAVSTPQALVAMRIPPVRRSNG